MTSERVVIVGAGGHAREVLEILLACRAAGAQVEPIGFVREGPEPSSTHVDGFPVLGDLGWFEGIDRTDLGVICAVGTPALCKRLVDRVGALGMRFESAVSPTAWVATTARLGAGVILFPNAVVNAGAEVGDHVTLNVAATVSHDARIGEFCSVGPGAHIAGNATLGARCFIGMGASVIHGVAVGPASVIGAGAVVLSDLPANVTAVGVPARVVGAASEHPMTRNRS